MSLTEPRGQQRTVPFVLESAYGGEHHVVADGAAFPTGRIVVEWRDESGTELIDTLESLYEKYGRDPRVMWLQEDGGYSEAEPSILTESR